jgi:antitoxin MazE
MQNIATTRLIRIGNSQGIRLPRVLAERLGADTDIEILLEGDSIILRPVTQPRAGWKEQFAAMAAAGDDALLDSDGPSRTRWDDEEWEW